MKICFFSQCMMKFARKTSTGPHIAEFSGRFLRISQAFCTQAAEYTHHYHIISIIWVNPHAPKVPPLSYTHVLRHIYVLCIARLKGAMIWHFYTHIMYPYVLSRQKWTSLIIAFKVFRLYTRIYSPAVEPEPNNFSGSKKENRARSQNFLWNDWLRYLFVHKILKYMKKTHFSLGKESDKKS